jgi:hypothetical protein
LEDRASVWITPFTRGNLRVAPAIAGTCTRKRVTYRRRQIGGCLSTPRRFSRVGANGWPPSPKAPAELAAHPDLSMSTPSQNPGVKSSACAPGWAFTELKLNPEPNLGGSRALLSPATREYLRYNPMAGLEETYLRNRLALRANCNLLDAVPQIDGFFSLTPREAYHVTALPYDHPNQSFPALLDFLGVSQTTIGGNTLEWAPRPSAMPPRHRRTATGLCLRPHRL